MLISEKELREAINYSIKRQLKESYKASPGESPLKATFSSAEDPYTYEPDISGWNGETLRIKVPTKDGKKFGRAFTVTGKNVKNPKVKRLTDAIIKYYVEEAGGVAKDTLGKEKFDSLKVFLDAVSKGETPPGESGDGESSDKKDNTKKGNTIKTQKKREELSYNKSWADLEVKTWLKSKIDSIEQVEIAGKYYLSYGFIKQGNISGLGILIPKKDFGTVRSAVGKFKLINKNEDFIYVKPRKGKQTPPSAGVVMVIPPGASGVKLGTTEFDDGATTAAEFTTLILDVIGGVPIIGEVADGTNVLVQLAMEPPRYFGAFLSGLGAIPAIGTAVVAIKLASRAGDIKNAVKAGKTFQKAMLEALGEDNMRKALKGKSMFTHIVNHKEALIGYLNKNVDTLEAIIPSIRRIIPDFEKFLNNFAKSYKRYKDYAPVKFKTEVGAWLSFTGRARGNALEEFKLDLAESGVSAFGVDPSDPARAMKSLQAKMTDFSDIDKVTEAQIAAATKMSKSLAKYLKPGAENMGDDATKAAGAAVKPVATA